MAFTLYCTTSSCFRKSESSSPTSFYSKNERKAILTDIAIGVIIALAATFVFLQMNGLIHFASLSGISASIGLKGAYWMVASVGLIGLLDVTTLLIRYRKPPSEREVNRDPVNQTPSAREAELLGQISNSQEIIRNQQLTINDLRQSNEREIERLQTNFQNCRYLAQGEVNSSGTEALLGQIRELEATIEDQADTIRVAHQTLFETVQVSQRYEEEVTRLKAVLENLMPSDEGGGPPLQIRTDN